MAEIADGSIGSSPSSFFETDGLLFFRAYDTEEDNELYLYDPKRELLRIEDINPTGSSYAGQTGFEKLGGSVYFMADDGTHGRELWSYDLASGTASLTADINPEGSSYASNFISVSGKLYFIAYTPELGHELWMYDPGKDAASPVSDINPYGSSLNGLDMEFTELDGSLYFFATTFAPSGVSYIVDIELYRHDTETGLTQQVADINPDGPSFISGYAEMAVFDEKLFFNAFNDATGAELWVYSPGDDSLELIDSIRPGPESANAGRYGFVEMRGEIYFAAHDGEHGLELWAYDLRDESTRLVWDIEPGAEGSLLGIDPTFTEFRGKLYFAARTEEYGYDLFVYDPRKDHVSALDLVEGDADSLVLVLGAMGNQLMVAVTEEVEGGLEWRAAVSHGVPKSAEDFTILEADGEIFAPYGPDAFIF
ncbi:hypothetical protein AYJ57_21245 (plasmid) [Salipiger sp. CCB-MM3]|uniref:hypothetical protein n=1 Tax=Salipiger sp. CCB-MM3 TaxID=1792508 RepID=UPI00080ABB09|nr:hypothetical protein [Salipiger sp. CCB-MM3]ANT63003.1 hypothetical protein AYJ57_21245 [Salipiger sp. CCB-MM3]